MRTLLSIFLFFLFITNYSQESFFVSSESGDNNNTGKSFSSPFKTIDRALFNVQPGDTINVMNGIYQNENYGSAEPHINDGAQSVNMNNPPAVIIGKSGSEGKYITIRNYPGHSPKIKFDGRGGILINGSQSYLIIEGFEIEGPAASVNYNHAIADRNWKIKCDQDDIDYTHSFFAGFGIWGGFSQDFLHHHIIVRNNVVHHTTGSGIRFNDSDHITIENNTVYNTTWWTSNASSAIVFAESKAQNSSDNNDDIKMIIRGNIVYNNWNRIPFFMLNKPPNSKPPSEDYGNAQYSAILDGQGLYVTRSDDDYYGTFLFENNLCVNNGKNGINFDRSLGSSALIRNNTIYFNGVHEIIQDISVGEENNPPHRGQKVAGIKANIFKNVTVVNNIVATREYDFYAMQIQNQSDDGTVKEANNNIFVNGKLPGYTNASNEYVIHNWVKNNNQIINDVNYNSNNFIDPIYFKNAPAIVNGAIDMSGTDFSLLENSPAINKGDPENSPSTDILGNIRPQPPENTISYTSFEESLSGWSAWSTSADNNTVSLSNELSRTGSRSLKVLDRTKTFHSAKFIIDELEVDKTYTIYIYAKLPEGESGTAQLALRKIIDTDASSENLISPVEISSETWTLLSADYTHESMDSTSYIFVKGPPVSGSEGVDYYLDDFSLVTQGTDEVDFSVVSDIVDIGAYEYLSQSNNDDSDNDGIVDSKDQCPDTPSGSKVDVTGCQIFELPVNNFKVEVGSATCIGTSDGVIDLSVEDASYDYTVTITGKENVTITGTNTTGSVTGLSKGTYEVCFTVDGQSGYQQCFEVVVGEPPALTAFIDIDNDNRTTSIQMTGSKQYNVTINGVKQKVTGNIFQANLSTGLSIIRVETDLECQGFVEKEVFISEDIHYYPNPTQSDVKVHVGGQDTRVKVSVFSEKGDLIYTRYQDIADISRRTNIDLTNQITGTYIVILESKTVRQTFKVIRE